MMPHNSANDMIQCNMVLYSPVTYYVTYHVTLSNTLRYITILYNTMQYHVMRDDTRDYNNHAIN